MNVHINFNIWRILLDVNPTITYTYSMLVSCISTAMNNMAHAIDVRDRYEEERKACDSVLSTDYILANAMWWHYEGIRMGASTEIASLTQVLETMCKDNGIDITAEPLYTTEDA